MTTKQKVDNNLLNSYEVEVVQQPDGSLRQVVQAIISAVPSTWDDIDLTYDSNNNLTGVVYMLASETVATLTLVYDASGNLTDVTRS